MAARKIKTVGFKVKVERVQTSWFTVHGLSGATPVLLGSPLGRSDSEEAALKDFVERVNAENRLNWTIKDLIVAERCDYVSK